MNNPSNKAKATVKAKTSVKTGSKKPAVKPKSKIVAGGKKQQRPLWQRITAAVLAFVLLGSIGSFGYYKWKERDLRAKAAAYTYPQASTTGDSRLKFAVCYKDSKTFGKDYKGDPQEYHEIVGIVTRPHGNYYGGYAILEKKYTQKSTAYTPTAQNYSWFNSTNPSGTDLTFVIGWATTTDWIRIRSLTYTDRELTLKYAIGGATILTSVLFIPHC